MYDVLNFIHTSNFYRNEQLTGLVDMSYNLNYVPDEFGHSSQDFYYVQPDAEKLFSEVLHSKVVISETSGKFYRPANGIHFNSFNNPTAWKFVVAIERSMFTMFYHKSGAKSALEGIDFNYNNMFEWDYQTNILMEPGQGLFYRPWMFHSLDCHATVQMFDLIQMPKPVSRTILVMGVKGSGKTTFAKELAKNMNATYLSSEHVCDIYQENENTIEGEAKVSAKLRRMALLSDTEFTVIDYKCERKMSRDYLAPDLVIWLNTVEPNSEMFEIPHRANIVFTSFDYDIVEFANKLLGK
jgi:hypothetical protein